MTTNTNTNTPILRFYNAVGACSKFAPTEEQILEYVTAAALAMGIGDHARLVMRLMGEIDHGHMTIDEAVVEFRRETPCAKYENAFCNVLGAIFSDRGRIRGTYDRARTKIGMESAEAIGKAAYMWGEGD